MKDYCKGMNRAQSIFADIFEVLPAAAPAADVVEVVRCKDCKYWEQSKIEPSFRVCTYVCGATFVREADDFCSRAEKREEEE